MTPLVSYSIWAQNAAVGRIRIEAEGSGLPLSLQKCCRLGRNSTGSVQLPVSLSGMLMLFLLHTAYCCCVLIEVG